MQIHYRDFEDVTILDATGELNESASESLRAIFRDLIAAGRRQLVLNLEDVANFSSAAVEPLVNAARDVAYRGGEVKLAGIQLSSDDSLIMARLYAVFDIADDHATAVCDFLMPSGVELLA